MNGEKSMTERSTDTFVVDFPESFGNARFDPQYIREAVAAVTYYNGTVSEKEACHLANTTRRQFEEVILPKFGLSVTGGTDEDASIEIEDV